MDIFLVIIVEFCYHHIAFLYLDSNSIALWIKNRIFTTNARGFMAEIMAKNFKTPIIFVTSHADEATLTRAKSVEPLGFINKPLRETDLKTTIEFAIAKIDSTGDEEEEKPSGSVEDVLIGLYSLTPAEARVTAKLLEVPELSYVSEALNISLSTAKTHLKRIYRKTNTNKQSLLVHKIVTGPAGAFMNKNPNSD